MGEAVTRGRGLKARANEWLLGGLPGRRAAAQARVQAKLQSGQAARCLFAPWQVGSRAPGWHGPSSQGNLRQTGVQESSKCFRGLLGPWKGMEELDNGFNKTGSPHQPQGSELG